VGSYFPPSRVCGKKKQGGVKLAPLITGRRESPCPLVLKKGPNSFRRKGFTFHRRKDKKNDRNALPMEAALKGASDLMGGGVEEKTRWRKNRLGNGQCVEGKSCVSYAWEDGGGERQAIFQE